MSLQFDIVARDGKARTGVLHTEHGDIRTPTVTVNFTRALANFCIDLAPGAVRQLGVDLILVNVVHDYLKWTHTAEIIRRWGGPVICDSGGFQMVSLDHARVSLGGVSFDFDNKRHHFSPREVAMIENGLKVDIAMPLDWVVDVKDPYQPLSFWWSALMTEVWFRKARGVIDNNQYYIVQGGLSPAARNFSLKKANYWLEQGVPGVAIGGLAGGEARPDMYGMVGYCTERLPEGKPRHLLGVGTPEDLLECIERGIDTFDCVAATREGRHGRLWTSTGRWELKYNQHKNDQSVIEPGCDCPACNHGITRGELIRSISHYSRNDSPERLQERCKAWEYCMLHNIRFLMRLMENVRVAIQEKKFLEFKQEFLKQFLRS